MAEIKLDTNKLCGYTEFDTGKISLTSEKLESNIEIEIKQTILNNNDTDCPWE